MTGKTTKAVMAIFAVALMMMVAFVPAISVLTDDGSDAAFAATAYTVVAKDKAGTPITDADLVLTAEITDENDNVYKVPSAFINGLVIAAGVLKTTDKSLKLTVTDNSKSALKYTFDTLTVKADAAGATVDILAKEYTISGNAGSIADIVVTVSGTASGTVNTITAGKYSFPAAAGSTVIVEALTQKVGATTLTFFGQKAVFTKVAGNYAAAQYPELTFVPDQFAVNGKLVDHNTSAGNIVGATVSYTVNSVAGSTVTGADGTYKFYVNKGGSYAVTGISYAGDAYTFAAADVAALKGNNITANVTSVTTKSIQYTASGTFNTSNTESGVSKIIVGASVTLVATSDVTIVALNAVTDSDGKYKFTYAPSATPANDKVTVTLSKTNFDSGTRADVALSAGGVTIDVTSKTTYAIGNVKDADGTVTALLEGVTVNVAAGYDGTKKSNATFAESAVVGADGKFVIPVTKGPVPAAGSTTETDAMILTITAPTGVTVFGYSFGTTAAESAVLENKTVTVGASSVGDIKALEKTSSVTLTLPAYDGGKVSVCYTVNGAAKNIYVDGSSSAITATIKVARGATVSDVYVDTTTEKFTIGSSEYDNAAFGKVTNPGTITFGKILANMTATFVDVPQPAKTQSVTVTVNPAATADIGAGMTYTNSDGKIVNATPILGAGSFAAVSMLKGTSFNVYMRGYETATTDVPSADTVTVKLSEPLTYTIFAKGYTVAGADKVLPGMTVRYEITDKKITDPTVADLTKSAVTNADGKVVIPITSGKFIAYHVEDKLNAYTWAAAIVQVDNITTSASADASAKQNGGITGVIKTFDGQVAMSGVTVGYEFYKTAESRTGTATATVKTNAAGIYFIPKVAETALSIAVYPVMSGYDFGTIDGTAFKAATYFVTEVNATPAQAASAIFGQKTTAVVKNVTVSISYMASSSLENNANSDNAEIVAPGVTNKMKVGDTVKFTAPEVKGFTFSGWYLDGVNVSDSKDKTVCNFTATEDMYVAGGSQELVAVYGADSVSEPVQGVSNAVIVIGVIAVIIALLAVAYVVIQTKKKD